MTSSLTFQTADESAENPPREVICNVWPVLPGTRGQELGEAVIVGRPVILGHERPSSMTTVELPRAGDYLVEVELPSGRSTRRFVSVPDDCMYLFSVHDRRYTSSTARSPVPPDPPSRSDAPLDIYNLNVMASWPSKPLNTDFEVRLLETADAIPLDELKSSLELGCLRATHGEVLKRGWGSSPFVAIQLPTSAITELSNHTARRWIRTSGPSASSTLIPYPSAWPMHSGREPFRLAARRIEMPGQKASTWGLSLELLDAAFGALLERLTRRDTRSNQLIARRMYGHRRLRLYGYWRYPVAEAAAGYFYALSSNPSAPAWPELIRMQKANPHVPDLAIALGWWLLRASKLEEQGWKDAKRLLLTSVRQGLPYYTLGLHILVDALNLLALAEPHDPDVKRWLSIVTALDTACVRDEPFTTLQISRFYPSLLTTPPTGD